MTEPGIHVEEGIVFGRGGGRDLRCDVVRPEGAATAGAPAPAPALLLVHGGGWRRGDRAMMRGPAAFLARQGFVCIATEYRLSDEARWPAHIHDTKAAIRWTRASAGALGIDPARIGMVGYSAGAHLSLLAAGTPGDPRFSGEGGHAGVAEDVAAVAVYYPPVRFHLPGERLSGASPATALAGDDVTAEEARAASPMEHVSAAFPPVFMLHGSDDRVVPPSASLRMYEALTAAGAPAEIHLFPGVPHGFARWPSFLEATHGEVALFMRRVMVEPERFAAEQAAATAP